MKPLRLALLAVLLVLIILAMTVGRHGLQIGVGHSAKQLRSGVFVAGLPESFLIERDIGPRMATLGPLRRWLDLRTDQASGLAETSLLGVSATAVHTPPRGCVLGGTPPPGTDEQDSVADPREAGRPDPRLGEAV